MDRWPLVAIDDLVEDIIDRRGVTPTKLGSDFTAAGHRVISAKLVKGGAIDLGADEPRYVDERTYARWMRSPLRADDVILTSEAPLGEVAYLRDDVDWVLGQRLFALRSDKRRLHGRWLYYALQADPSRSELHSRATGTTAQGIRQTELRRVRIPLPPLAEQRRIAGILGALDDRIELDQRVSATLEATAQALFASRFVDDLRGSTTGEVAFGQVAQLVRELIDPQASPELLIDHYSLPAFDSGREPVRERGRAIKSVKTLVLSGSVLVSKLNPAIDRVWLADPSPGVVSVSSTEFLVLMPRAPVGRAFLYCLARSDLFRRGLIELATGTSNSHQRVATASMMEILVPEPDASEAGRFEAVAGPLLLRSAAARRESRSLREIRDALLPRLLSGAPTSGPARTRAFELSTRSA